MKALRESGEVVLPPAVAKCQRDRYRLRESTGGQAIDVAEKRADLLVDVELLEE